MNENQQVDNTTYSDLVKPFASKWRMFLISILFFLLSGITYIYYNAPLYKVQAKVLIKDAKKSSAGSSEVANIGGLSGLGSMQANSIENELQVITSKNIAEQTVRDLHLQTSYFKKDQRFDIELFGDEFPYKILILNEKQSADYPKRGIDIVQTAHGFILKSKGWEKDVKGSFGNTLSLDFANIIIIKNKNYRSQIKKNDLSKDSFYFTITSFESAVEILQKDLNVSLADEESTVFILEMIYKNRLKAKAIINSVINIYNGYAQIDKAKDDEKSRDFIDERLTIISKELGTIEADKESFKKNNEIVDLPTQSRIDLQTSVESNQKLLDLDTKMQLNDIMLSYINNVNYELLPTSIGVENPTSASIIGNYNNLVIQRKKFLENATSENPLVRDLTNQIDDLRKALKESIRKSKSALAIARGQTVGQENKAELGMEAFPKKERLYRGIERQQQIKENLYLMLLEKREEASIKLAMTAEKARVIDAAYSSLKPVSPKKIIILLSSIIIGLILPFLYILIKTILSNKIITKDDVSKLTNIPVISEIPNNKKSGKEIININLNTSEAEAFRILSTNLKFVLPKKEKANNILITSSVKGEGKTYIAINTALSLAASGKKVVLIGGDLRNPQLQRYDESKRNAVGLSDYLSDYVDSLNEIISPSVLHKNCDFIYSGTIPPNPVELLSNGKFDNLLDDLSIKYDYILIDAAPMMPVTDTSMIAMLADTTLYVVRSEYSDKKFIEFINHNKKNSIIKNPVLVLNNVSKVNFGYGNTYGYGYQNDVAPLWSRVFNFFK
ncbi:polysaccharide biosynthesis tyrosine autokinase [Chryseobacterium aquaticum]|uniref:GumC family protein n=1 Tax=Chryseobacterium aquaticum TaxID=452084 RepID=UPI002FC98404